MKHLFTTFALAFSLPVIAQTDITPRPRSYNTFGLAMEVGGGLTPASYVWTWEFRTTEHASIGYTGFYERQFNFGKRSGLAIGIGFNTTLFSSHVHFANIDDTPYTMQTETNTITIQHSGGEHDLGRVKHFYMALDFPILYTHTFDLKKQWQITPYAGVKFRNVFLIDAESTFRGHAKSVVETRDGDTTFAMTPTYRSRMYDTRIVALPTIGVRATKMLPQGGALNFFADYSAAIYNTVEMRYSNLSSDETITTTAHYSSTGETITSEQDVHFARSNESPLIMALKMSHMRAGISYTLPNRR